MITQSQLELELIARFLIDKTLYQENADLISVDMFVDYPHLFNTYKKAFESGLAPSLSKLITEHPAEKEVLLKAVKSVHYNLTFDDIIGELTETKNLRIIQNKLIECGLKDTSREKAEVLNTINAEFVGAERGKFLTGYEILKDVIEEYRGNKKAGLKTGFTYYDNFSGGLHKSDLVIIAGETSQSKTSLALNIADYIADKKTPVAIVSLEMSNGQLLSRLVCSRIGLPIKKIRENILSFERAAGDYIEMPIYVADIKNNGVNSICGMIRAMVMKHGVEVAVIDYLQLVSDKSKGSREQEIGGIARIFKNLAKELNITVIALSQLARDKNRPYPTLARLRDSGQIEEAADVVIFVYRPEAYGLTDYQGLQTENLAEVIVAKGRNIGTCKFFLNFRAETTKFTNYEHQETAAPY